MFSNNMKYDPNNIALRNSLSKGEFGLEMESLRINHDGTLAQTPHPFESVDNITRDFCENQTEIITDVFDNISDMLTQLSQLQNTVYKTLNEDGELLWRFSNPPAFTNPDEIPIADFKGSVYRDYLAQKYGKVKMLLSGIHLNYSLPISVIAELSEGTSKSLQDFQNDLYLDLASKLLSYSWLIVYLTAASPVIDQSFAHYSGISDSNKYASVRCSEAGYWNFFTPIFDFSSLNAYTDSIEKYIDNGDIISCSEIYYPIRVKPRGKYDIDLLRKKGINHIELRMIDLNPLSPIGVFEKDLEFIHLLIIYLLSVNKPLPDKTQQLVAVSNMKAASLYDESSPINVCTDTLPLKDAAIIELKNLYDFAKQYYPKYLDAVTYQLSKTETNSYSQIIRELFSDDYIRKGIAISKKYQRSGQYVHAFCGKLGQ